MKPFLILAMLLSAPLAAAQTVTTAPSPWRPQQPLNLDPKLPLNLDGTPAVPVSPAQSSGSNLLILPNSGGASLAPSLRQPAQPDSMPPDRHQEMVPALRLKVPL